MTEVLVRYLSKYVGITYLIYTKFVAISLINWKQYISFQANLNVLDGNISNIYMMFSSQIDLTEQFHVIKHWNQYYEHQVLYCRKST